MRIRSKLSPAGPASSQILPNRSRSSKVQNNVVHLIRMIKGQNAVQRLPVWVELQPLADKRALTIATAILQVFETIQTHLNMAGIGMMLHVVVGDSIGTNFKAASLVFRVLNQQESMQGRYFMAALKCSSHQANLATGAAIALAPGERSLQVPGEHVV